MYSWVPNPNMKSLSSAEKTNSLNEEIKKKTYYDIIISYIIDNIQC